MGFFDEDYSVGLAEGRVRDAENYLASQKRNRESAKACGNYRNRPKSTRWSNGKLGNCYDVNVWGAERALKEAKEQLARAKEKAREAKIRKQEEAREEKKRKQDEAKKASVASKGSSSSSRSSSASSAVKSSVVVAAVATSLSKPSPSYSEPSSYSHSESSSYSTRGTVSSNNINGSCGRSKPAKSSRNGLVALILCIFFGVIGAHRFYVGKTGTGILQLFTAGGYFIWVLVDFVHILTGKFTDSEGNVIRVGW